MATISVQRPRVRISSEPADDEMVQIRVGDRDITIYPWLGSDGVHVVVEIDDARTDGGTQPGVRVYRNDGQVYREEVGEVR